MVDDNFHYMDEDERSEYATFSTAGEALAACRMLVDEWLVRHHKPGMSADELYQHYTSFGYDPFIVAPPQSERVHFSAWDYARGRIEAICGTRVSR